MKSLYDETYSLLKRVEKESAGEFSIVTCTQQSGWFMGAIVDILANVRIGGRAGYDAYLILEEKILPFAGRSDLNAITKGLLFTQKKAEEEGRKKVSDFRVYGVLVTKGLIVGAREELRTKRIPYIDVATNEVFLPLPGFFFSESSAASTEPDGTLEELMANSGFSGKSGKALLILLDGGTEHVWTIKELAERSDLASSAVHKLKHRLLRLGIVVPSNVTAGMTKFHLSDAGKKAIEDYKARK